jgi:antitoxin component YwqK of YwqJK toxin-antitoxin module
MKLILACIVFSFCQLGLSQNDLKNNVIVIKEYHKNGKLYQEYEFDTVINTHAGFYREYDSLGEIKIKGAYKIVDSVRCKDCYEGHPEYPDNPSVWTKKEFSDERSIQTGVWQQFHPNGEEASEGEYAELVHETKGGVFPTIGTFYIASGILKKSEQLKEGYWYYYDEEGRLIKQEEFVDGVLVYVVK